MSSPLSALRPVMNRIITFALMGLTLSALVIPAPSSARTEWRNYLLGVGILEMPSCEDENSLVSLFSVCFRLASSDATAKFEILEDVDVLPVLGAVKFYNDTTGLVGTPLVFCGESGDVLIPEAADEVRVVLGTLPFVFEAVELSCLPGVATRGVVEGQFN